MAGIYLDHNASMPIDPAVPVATQPFPEEAYGNPSSGRWASALAKAILESSRGKVATLLGGGIGGVVAVRRLRGANRALPLVKIAFEKCLLFGWS